ncbi:MAG: hypothetical protein IT385_06460 [Deltaproteobacteria bacterium]|nr:hypothetical protein [Deltaproteobacteria bacterium]
MSAYAYLHPMDLATHERRSDGGGVEEGADPDELAAVRAALGGDLGARLRIGARALRKILADPNDTKQVFTLFLTMNARHIPRFLTRFVTEPGGVELLAERPAIDSRTVDFAALARLSEDTLGGAFARHLSSRGLSPDIFRAPPGIPPALAYLGQRMRQSHDIWHVLAGYDTTVDDELALLAFSYGQSGMPGPAVLAVLGGLRWLPRHPGVFRKILDGYRRGKAARSLITARWEAMWHEPLAAVRERFGIRPRAA